MAIQRSSAGFLYNAGTSYRQLAHTGAIERPILRYCCLVRRGQGTDIASAACCLLPLAASAADSARAGATAIARVDEISPFRRRSRLPAKVRDSEHLLEEGTSKFK